MFSSEKSKYTAKMTKEILYNSVSQCIIKIIETKHIPVKIFLFGCLVATSSIGSYMIISSIMDFFKYEVI